MARLLAIVIAVAYTAVLALLVLWMLNVTGLDLCPTGNRALVLADECIDGTGTERAVGLILGWASVVTAVAAVAIALLAARGRRVAGRLGLAVLATPILAAAGLLLLPVSF